MGWRYKEAEEVDHAELIARLVSQYPDGWALSTNSVSLKNILPLCPSTVRIAAWVKPFAVFKPNVNPAYCWEPIIFRTTKKHSRLEPTIRDWVSVNITLKKGLVGAKPREFCEWLLDLLGFGEGDSLDDLYPGTGIMGITMNERRDRLAAKK